MPAITTPAAATRRLVGRTIVRVELHPFDGGREESPSIRTFKPTLFLDDGTALVFSVDETEVGVPGVTLIVSPKKRRKAR